MAHRKVKVAIIGAGSAGLSAFGEVRKVTDDLVVIQNGPYGTTCARVGCMPSKVLIQAANDFHRRHKLAAEGIFGGNDLQVDTAKTMQFVRSLRDRFVRGVMGTVEAIGDRNLQGFAQFVEPNVLSVGDDLVEAEKIIIATGSSPIIPEEFEAVKEHVLTSDEIFEIEKLPESIAVFGSGVIGLELGQAMHRLGSKVELYARSPRVSGLTDPQINEYALNSFKNEMSVHVCGNTELSLTSEGKVLIRNENKECVVDKVLSAVGRSLNVKNLGLEKIGVKLDEKGLPQFNRNTMQVEDLPIYIAGDVNNERPILHEASDEGKIAGYNAVRDTNTSFKRSTPIYVTFSDPDIAMVGQSYKELKESGREFEFGEVTFEGQGRSIVMQKENGLLHVYGDAKTGELLGAEMIGPHCEHLAHLLAWSIEQKLTVFDVVKFPFYHPVVEEGLRTALRNLLHKVDSQRYFELDTIQ